MNALTLTRRLRPAMWSLAALGMVAILFGWGTGTWGPFSANRTSRHSIGAYDSSKPGLAIYPAGKRTAAPKLQGTTLDGDPFTLSQLTGNIVVLNVWGSWCAPCRAETPDLVRLSRRFADRGVHFVGINTRDNPAAARSFVSKFNVPYPSVGDEDGRLLLNFRNVIPTAVVPSSVVIDGRGKVAARIIGRVTYSTLQGLLEDELAARGDRG